jgi:hypothetical protein
VKLPYSCHCGRRWSALGEAHCAADGCHEQFSTVRHFDRHRMNGACVWPAALYRRDGQPFLRLVERAGGPTWVDFEERPKEAYTPVIVATKGVR